jgi:RimJ/RimL family protein N-acetyltransferase
MQPELLGVPERLDGARVFLRPYTDEDAAAQWEAIEESRAHMRPWLRRALGFHSVDAVRVALARDRAAWVTRERLIFGLFERDGHRYLGEVALHHIEWDVPWFLLGYWIRASAAGHGFMREGIELVTRMAFDQLGARRVEARVDRRNVRSRRVLEALGWQCEGTLRQSARDAEGELIDLDVFALIAEPQVAPA